MCTNVPNSNSNAFSISIYANESSDIKKVSKITEVHWYHSFIFVIVSHVLC